MAVVALTAEYLALAGSAALNDHVKSATLTVDANELDATAMGDTWKEVVGGVKAGTLSIEFFDDTAASNVDSIIWGHFNTGTTITFEVRLSDAAVSATNPKYTGSVLPKSASFGGSHGELPMKSLTWPTSGAVTRATS